MRLIRPIVMTPIWIAFLWIAWHDLDVLWAAIVTTLSTEHTFGLWVDALGFREWTHS